MKPTLAELSDALLSVFEGPARLTAFQDPGGVWTIGRGHTRGVTPGMVITSEQSNIYFAQDQQALLTMVAGQRLFAGAAYVSFGYNCGRSALFAVLKGFDRIDNPLHTTDRHGTVLPGLVSRRLLERLMVEGSTP
jgi:GH24 family phage-related lysozyme (muramidase)